MFFFIPDTLMISDVFSVQQGKNILNKSFKEKSSKPKSKKFLLTVNSVDFEYNYINETKLQTYDDYSELNDKKFLLQNTDLLVNRVGNNCKTISMLSSNIETSESIIISQNFIFLRAKQIVPNSQLSYFHFLIQICIDQLLKSKNISDLKQQYITVKDIEQIKIPTELFKINFETFDKLNNELNESYSKVFKSYNKLHESKNKIENYKKEVFESLISQVNLKEL